MGGAHEPLELSVQQVCHRVGSGFVALAGQAHAFPRVRDQHLGGFERLVGLLETGMRRPDFLTDGQNEVSDPGFLGGEFPAGAYATDQIMRP